MAILDRFRSQTKTNRAQPLDAARDAMLVGSITPRFKDFHSYLQSYKLPWVHACVSVIAYNAANVGYKLVRANVDASEGSKREVTSSPLLDLLAQPNENQSGFQLFEQAWTDLELTGNAFLSLEAIDGRGRPHEMYRLRPDSVTVVPDPVTLVRQYLYVVNGRSVPYEPEEMLHLRYANPLNDLYGMGMIEAAEARIDSDMAMADHERNFWRNGAKITGVLQTDATVTDSVFARVTQSLRRFLTGSGYQVAVLEAGLKYQSVSDGPAKLGMLPMGKASRDQILAIFGVPPTKVGILENANYKATASDEFFWTETIDPKLTRMEKAVQPLVERFHPGEHLKIEFDRLNFMDDSAPAEVAKTMHETLSYTLNEIRAFRGLEPVEGGDVIVDLQGQLLDLTGSLATLNEVRTRQGEPPLPGGDDMIIMTGRATQFVLGGGQPAQMNSGIQAPAPVREGGERKTVKAHTSANHPATGVLLTRHRDAALAKADRHTPNLTRFFEGQERRVTAKLEGFKRRKATITVDALFDDDDERERLEGVVTPIHTDGAEAGFASAKVADLDISFDLDNPRLSAYLGQLATRVVGINDTTKAAIDEQVNAGLAKGYSVQQIAAGVPGDDYPGISGVFADAKSARAQTIARTETMTAYNGASVIAYKESGVVDRVEFLDGTDDAACAAVNGMVVPLAQAQAILDAEHPNGTRVAIPLVSAA